MRLDSVNSLIAYTESEHNTIYRKINRKLKFGFWSFSLEPISVLYYKNERVGSLVQALNDYRDEIISELNKLG